MAPTGAGKFRWPPWQGSNIRPQLTERSICLYRWRLCLVGIGWPVELGGVDLVGVGSQQIAQVEGAPLSPAIDERRGVLLAVAADCNC